MKRTNKIILMIALVSLLVLGIGYATIQNITLTISGKAGIEAKQENFNVGFLNTEIEVSDSNFITAEIEDNTTATINVDGLSKVGETVYAIYKIKNESIDLSADLSIATSSSETEYLKISSQLEKASLKAGEETTVKVNVTVTKTPINDNIIADIGVGLTAMPVQPGEEGTSEGIKDFSQTPELNEYGFYYDKFYVIHEDNIGIMIHPDNSSEVFELWTKEEYPKLEKDEWFCIDYNGPGETKIEEAFGEGARVENEGKTIIGESGSVATLSDIVPHGMYKCNRYETINENGSTEVWTFLDNLSLNMTKYDTEGGIVSASSVDNYFQMKANDYMIFIVEGYFGTFNITGDVLYCENGNVYKIKEIHNYEFQIIQDATCTEEGTLKGTCSDCSDYYTINIEPYNHKFDSDFNSICDICGEKIQSYNNAMVTSDSLYYFTGNNDTEAENVRILPYVYEELLDVWRKVYRLEYDTFDKYTKLKTITIPNTITTIDSSTFDRCKSLTTVNYTGTKEQWNAIQIGSGNDPLINATINYNYEMPIE